MQTGSSSDSRPEILSAGEGGIGGHGPSAGPRGAPSSAGSLQRPRRRRWWMFAGAAAAVVGLAACAQPGRGGEGQGPGWGWHHRGHHGPMDPETIARRIDRGVDRVLSDVGASAEQKQKVSAIAKAAVAELTPLRDRHRAARTRVIEILSAPTVDRGALEKVRAEELAMAEGASRRVTQALADIADVLTPEQRVKLREKAERRMGRRWGERGG